MDINDLLRREQIERMLADRAANDNVRAAHADRADLYRALVDGHRRDALAAARPGAVPPARAPRP